jgi:hypothetical protein
MGFSPKVAISAFEKNRKIAGRVAWKSFRELVISSGSSTVGKCNLPIANKLRVWHGRSATLFVLSKHGWQGHAGRLHDLSGNTFWFRGDSELFATVLNGDLKHLVDVLDYVCAFCVVSPGFQPVHQALSEDQVKEAAEDEGRE